MWIVVILIALAILTALYYDTRKMKEVENKVYKAEKRALHHYGKLHKIESLIREYEENKDKAKGNPYTLINSIKEVIYERSEN